MAFYIVREWNGEDYGDHRVNNKGVFALKEEAMAFATSIYEKLKAENASDLDERIYIQEWSGANMLESYNVKAVPVRYEMRMVPNK